MHASRLMMLQSSDGGKSDAYRPFAPMPYRLLLPDHALSPLQFMLAGLLRGSATGVALSPLPLLRALLQTILAPLLVGVSIRALVPGTNFPYLVWRSPLPTASTRSLHSRPDAQELTN